MHETRVLLHSRFQVGRVDPRLFGGFLEHMGRAVYQGVYEPESAQADEDGFRSDVLSALRRLEMTVMRYPGGNFSSGYHWLDGVGPRENRPAVRELAWQSIEPNWFGTDEYIRLCRKAGWSPMITVNLGTGTPKEARNWVEYCNCPQGTRYADRSLETVVCGSCGVQMPTYMEWDRTVLEHLGDLADYVSLHRYVGNPEGDTSAYLAVNSSVDRQIEEMDAACRYVQARKRSRKRAWLCFDEWNVWYKNMQMDGQGRFAPHLVEEQYNLEDALVVAGFLNSFIRHAYCLRIANLAQIVNVIAPLMTDGDRLLLQSIFYPFAMVSSRRKGVSLRVALEGPSYEAGGETVSFIDAGAILEGGSLKLFLINRSQSDAASVAIELADGGFAALQEGELLSGPTAQAANSFEEPDTVKTQAFAAASVRRGRALLELPALSFTALTLRLA